MYKNIFFDDEFVKIARWCVTCEQWVGTTPIILLFKFDQVKAQKIYNQLRDHGIIKKRGGYTRPNITQEQLELLIKIYRKDIFDYADLSKNERKYLLKTILTEKLFHIKKDEIFSFNYIVEKNGVSYGIQYVHDHKVDACDVLSGYLKKESSGIDSVIVISVKGATEEGKAIAKYLKKIFLWDLFEEEIDIFSAYILEEGMEKKIDKILATVYDDKKRINEYLKLGEQACFLPVSVNKDGIVYTINLKNSKDIDRIVYLINEQSKLSNKLKIIINNGAICLFSYVENIMEELADKFEE